MTAPVSRVRHFLPKAIPLFVLAGRAAGGIGFAPHPVPRTTAPTPFDESATAPDPRGRRHPLSAILGVAALAMLVGRRSLAGIARFGRQYGPSPAFALGVTRGKTPSCSALSRTLAALDAAALEGVLARWVAARIDPADAEHLSRDGKTRRGPAFGTDPEFLDAVAGKAPDHELEVKEAKAELHAGLRQLKAMDRETLEAFYLRGRSLEQMASEFEAPVGTIKRRLHVARHRLKEVLEAKADPFDATVGDELLAV